MNYRRMKVKVEKRVSSSGRKIVDRFIRTYLVYMDSYGCRAYTKIEPKREWQRSYIRMYYDDECSSEEKTTTTITE
jgi:uncharacterized protein with ParB-like and HNH nuclease domain